MRPLNAKDLAAPPEMIKTGVTQNNVDALMKVRKVLASGNKDEINKVLSGLAGQPIDVDMLTYNEDDESSLPGDSDASDRYEEEIQSNGNQNAMEQPNPSIDLSRGSSSNPIAELDDEDLEDFEDDFGFDDDFGNTETTNLTTTEFEPVENSHPQTTSTTAATQATTPFVTEDDDDFDDIADDPIHTSQSSTPTTPVDNVQASQTNIQEQQGVPEGTGGDETVPEPQGVVDPADLDKGLQKARKGPEEVKSEAEERVKKQIFDLGRKVFDVIPQKFLIDENEDATEEDRAKRVEDLDKALNFIGEALQVMGNTGAIPESAEIEYDDEMLIKKYPVVLPLDVHDMVKRSGNEKFTEFIENVNKKIVPMVQNTIVNKFDEQYETLPETLVGQIVANSDTGFEYYVESVDDTGVTMADVDYYEDEQGNSNMEKSSVTQHVTTAVFREEFEIVT